MNNQDNIAINELEELDDEVLADADQPSWLDGKDDTLTMESVPFKEKVEKWLMTCDDSGSQVKKNLKNSGRLFEEKIVVSKTVETESLHSVDTEQYIKSNRTKTTTKITTTTIRKYYSLLKVGRNRYNNNDETYLGNRIPLPAIRKISTNEGEIKSCKVGRRSSRRQRTSNLYVEDEDEDDVIKTKRRQQVPGFIKSNRGDANKFNDQNVCASTSRACNPQRIMKRVTKKRNKRGSRNKLSTSCVDGVDLSAVRPNTRTHKKRTAQTKIENGLKTIRDDDNVKYTNHVSSDSEEDILLTSYRTLDLKYFKSF